MHESPYDERRLEVLRASCIGQPREMVDLFFAPMRNMSTSRRIEEPWTVCVRDMAFLVGLLRNLKLRKSVPDLR